MNLSVDQLHSADGPLLRFKSAVNIWAWGMTLSILVWFFSRIVGEWLLLPYFVGHFILSGIVGWGRLSGDRSFSTFKRNWIDVLVILGVPWIGPITWFSLWKKRQHEMAKSGPVCR